MSHELITDPGAPAPAAFSADVQQTVPSADALQLNPAGGLLNPNALKDTTDDSQDENGDPYSTAKPTTTKPRRGPTPGQVIVSATVAVGTLLTLTQMDACAPTSQDNKTNQQFPPLTCSVPSADTQSNTQKLAYTVGSDSCSPDKLKELPVAQLEYYFNSLAMERQEAEKVWTMTQAPDLTETYQGTDGVTHLERVAYDLASALKQNTDFQNQVRAILANKDLAAKLTTGDITDANEDGTVTMPIPQQGAWAELHQTTADKPKWQTDETYALTLWLNQGKLTTQQEKDFNAMMANADNNNWQNDKTTFPYKDITSYKTLPVKGVVLYKNTQVIPVPAANGNLTTPDGKMLSGYIDYGFYVDGKANVIRLKLTSEFPNGNGAIFQNIGGQIELGDWDNQNTFTPQALSATELDAALKPGRELVLGFSFMDPAKYNNDKSVLSYANMPNTIALEQWLAHQPGAKKPDAVITSTSQLANPPMGDVYIHYFSPYFD